jgi:hypothetical protein
MGHGVVVVIRFVNHDWFAIKVWISEEFRGFFKVHNGEEVFVVLFFYTGATTDDLFENGH